MAESAEDIPFILKETHVINGILRLKVTTPEVLQQIKEFPVYEDDIFVCGYPKSGNVWMLTILTAILNQEDLSTLKKSKTNVGKKQLECSFATACVQPRPGVFWTHVDYNMIPNELKNRKCKLIYMIRNPKDVAVSFYHWHKIFIPIGPWNGRWEVFLEHFLNGSVPCGDWFDHVRSFWPHRYDNNMFFVKYEDLKMDTKLWITKIASFIGKPLTPMKVKEIVEMVEFTNMKNDPFLTVDDHPLFLPGSHFMRKGVIGDWRNVFTDEQNKSMEEKLTQLRQKMGCDVSFE